MAVDLRWRDAMAIWGARRVFTPVQKQAGWPEAMEPQHLAALQRPWDQGDNKGRSGCLALRDAITEACATGQLECVALSVEPPERQQDDDVFRPIPMVADRWAIDVKPEWSEREFLGGTLRTQRRVPQQPQRSPSAQTARLEYRVGAQAFAAWLTAQQLEPSPHVFAWFAVRGVAWPPASADTKAGEDSPFPLSDFPALVAYRKANTKGEGGSKKGPSWALGNQIDVGKAELARRMATGVMESEALNAMGRELGIGGAAPRTPLKKALFSDRKRSPPVKLATPLPGVVQVRSGRKTA